MMMTIVGTLTFNFAVVMPLFVEHTFHGGNGSFTLALLGVERRVGDRCAGGRPHAGDRHPSRGVGRRSGSEPRCSFSPARRRCSTAFPIAVFVGLTSVAFITTSTAIVQVQADPAMRGRVLALQGMVLIGSTPIGGPLLGLDLRHLRGAGRHPGRCGRRGRRGRLGLRHAPADRGVPRRRRHPRGGVGPLDVGLIAAPPP